MTILRIALACAFTIIVFALGYWLGSSRSSVDAPVQGVNAEERLVTLLQMQEPMLRARALALFFSDLIPTDVEAIEQVYRDQRRHVDEVAEVLFAAWWARFDPAGALDGRIPPNWGGDDPWTRTVVREWIRADPVSGLAAVMTIPPNPEAMRLEACRALIWGWFEHGDTDPDALIPVIDQINLVRPRGEMLNQWAKAMLDARGVDYAIRYAESMPEDPMRVKREMMGRLAAIVVMDDPDRAVDFTERNADSEAGTKMRVYLVNRWAYVDGPAAMAWALSVQSKNREDVVERAWRSFLIGDRDKALAWMAEQPHSAALEPAYVMYLIDVAREDHRRALALSESIDDPEDRLRIWQAVGRSWIVEDADAAEAWMAEMDLPPEVVEKIRARKERRPVGRIQPHG
jgi:hypothetical protein